MSYRNASPRGWTFPSQRLPWANKSLRRQLKWMHSKQREQIAWWNRPSRSAFITNTSLHSFPRVLETFPIKHCWILPPYTWPRLQLELASCSWVSFQFQTSFREGESRSKSRFCFFDDGAASVSIFIFPITSESADALCSPDRLAFSLSHCSS